MCNFLSHTFYKASRGPLCKTAIAIFGKLCYYNSITQARCPSAFKGADSIPRSADGTIPAERQTGYAGSCCVE